MGVKKKKRRSLVDRVCVCFFLGLRVYYASPGNKEKQPFCVIKHSLVSANGDARSGTRGTAIDFFLRTRSVVYLPIFFLLGPSFFFSLQPFMYGTPNSGCMILLHYKRILSKEAFIRNICIHLNKDTRDR